MLLELKCGGEEVQKWDTEVVKVQGVFMYKNIFQRVEAMRTSHHLLDAFSVTCFTMYSVTDIFQGWNFF